MRIVDLSAYAGKTINQFLVGQQQCRSRRHMERLVFRYCHSQRRWNCYRDPSLKNGCYPAREAKAAEMVTKKSLDEFHRMGVTLHSR